jgi:hypothetical protein
MPEETPRLTPTERLVLEILAARHRLGETYWTFDIAHRPSLARLEKKGLVTYRDGVAPGFEAKLTDDGMDLVLLGGWKSADARAVEWVADQLTDPAALSWWSEQAAELGLDPVAVMELGRRVGVAFRGHGMLLSAEARAYAERSLMALYVAEEQAAQGAALSGSGSGKPTGILCTPSVAWVEDVDA